MPASQKAPPPPESLNETSIAVFTWIMTGAAILFSFVRYGVRYWSRRKLLWDDLAHFLAMLTAVGMSVCFQLLYPSTFLLTAVGRGFASPLSPQQTAALFVRNTQLQLAVIMQFALSTWFIKISFLLMYKELFWINKKFRLAWWIVLAFVVVTFWGFFAGAWTRCGAASDSLSIKECTSPEHMAMGIRYIKAMCFLCVSSDIAVMVLPLWQLHTLQIKAAQKISLAVIFSIGLVIVALDIARTVSSVAATDFSQVAAYDIAETTVAVIVCALPTYRALFHRDTRPSQKASYYKDLNGSKSNGSSGRRTFGSSKGNSQYGRDFSGVQSSITETDTDVYPLNNRVAVHPKEHV